MYQLPEIESHSPIKQQMAVNTPERGESTDFFQFFREKISIEMLLSDRLGQATLARLLSHRTTRDRNFAKEVTRAGTKILVNPYPVVELEMPNGTSWKHDTFQLLDREYYYYFGDGNPIAEVPPYLRPEDVVPSETYSKTYPPENVQRAMRELGVSLELFKMLCYEDDPRLRPYVVLVDIPFNKALNRVSVTGGRAERFNYVTQSWEDNQEGEYKPGFGTKVREAALQMWRRRETGQRQVQRRALPEPKK